ncbi:unnamed protein product, partial [Lymnaea stagnalis]
RWVCKVLHHFLVLKSDHHQLKFHSGDTYFHATISIVVQSNTQRQETLDLVGVDNVHDNPDVDHDGDSNADATELLRYVVENIVIPTGDLNIQDDKGNTVLHHLATLETYPISVLSYILSKDVDCLKVNNVGKTALDLTNQSDKRNLLFGKAMTEDDSKTLAKIARLKTNGNHCFCREDFHGAIKEYTIGIQMLEIARSENEGNTQFYKWDKSLAQLHGKRSECWFKLAELMQCLEDAKRNVDYHPEGYKGHYRVAEAYKELGQFKEAVNAFVKAYNRLTSSDGEDLDKKILKDLIETAFVTESQQADSLQTELNKVPATLKAHIINSYLEKKDWNIVEFIVTRVLKITDSDLRRPTLSKTSKWIVNLVHFCEKDLLSKHWWVCKVLHHFLVLKSDHHQLKFHPGDTYFHATISIVVQSNTQKHETLDLVGVDNVHDNPDVDHDGDSNADATELLRYVVENIVIPNGDLNIQDDKGNTVLHHLATYETYPISVLTYVLSKDVDFLKVNKDGKTALDLTNQSDKRNLLFGKVVAQLVACIDKHKHVKNVKEKKKLKEKSIQALTSLLPCHVNPVIPKELLKISADSCKDLLTSFADAGKWLVLKELVIQFQQAKGGTTLPTFAKEMSLTRVVEAPVQEMMESDKIDVVRFLVNHEASVDSPGAIEASIQNEEWKLTMELLDLGVNPDGVTLRPGDTPYHAALDLA